MPEDAEGDHLAKNGAELVAATHVADGHEVGNDQTGQLGPRPRLEDLAQAPQSIQPICTAAAVSTWTAATEPLPSTIVAQGERVWPRNFKIGRNSCWQQWHGPPSGVASTDAALLRSFAKPATWRNPAL